ncbi:unnamed protein product [Lepidochelys kempii]
MLCCINHKVTTDIKADGSEALFSDAYQQGKTEHVKEKRQQIWQENQVTLPFFLSQLFPLGATAKRSCARSWPFSWLVLGMLLIAGLSESLGSMLSKRRMLSRAYTWENQETSERGQHTLFCSCLESFMKFCIISHYISSGMYITKRSLSLDCTDVLVTDLT